AWPRWAAHLRSWASFWPWKRANGTPPSKRRISTAERRHLTRAPGAPPGVVQPAGRAPCDDVRDMTAAVRLCHGVVGLGLHAARIVTRPLGRFERIGEY